MERPMTVRRIFQIAVAIALMLAGANAYAAGPELGRFDEYQVKAAFIFNFAKFVAWPDSSATPLVIGIAGEDPFGDLLDNAVRGKTAAGRTIEVRRLGDKDDPHGCNILFVSASEKRRFADLIQRAGNGVLTVGELPEFAQDGGVVRFFIENNRVRFQINAKAVEKSGLKIHSQLMSLAAH
jgi:hypothetical protein